MDFGLTKQETKVFAKLDSPAKIQDFLDRLAYNFEKHGDTLRSPRSVLKERKAHCIEGALLAASILRYHGHKPLLLDLVSHEDDMDHVVCLFKQNGYWGAISKTNHIVLRWRDPIYKSIRELALSYFHEYFLPDGSKSLLKFSAPFDLREFGTDWITSGKNLWKIGDALDASKHFEIVPKENKKYLRKASRLEIKAGRLVEWKK